MVLLTNEQIIKKYEEFQSVKRTAEELNCSWNRVVKALSTEDYVVNDLQEVILYMYDKGIAVEEIAEITRRNVKTVQAYLPRVRPLYGEAKSYNAQNLIKFRQRKLDKS